MLYPYENEPVDAWGQSRTEWKNSAARRQLLGSTQFLANGV
jgi:hypothetical protein